MSSISYASIVSIYECLVFALLFCASVSQSAVVRINGGLAAIPRRPAPSANKVETRYLGIDSKSGISTCAIVNGYSESTVFDLLSCIVVPSCFASLLCLVARAHELVDGKRSRFVQFVVSAVFT